MVVCSLKQEKARVKGVTINLSSIVMDMLQQLGISSRLSGFLYLQEGICIAVDDFELAQKSIVYGLYPEISEKVYNLYGGNRHSTNKIPITRIERCIRHAIQTSWEDKKPFHEDAISKIFGEERLRFSKSPSNKEYICGVALYIRNKYNI